MTVDFLAVGHITHDQTPAGVRLGGTVSYAAVTARCLGRRAAILTKGTLNGLTVDLYPEACGPNSGALPHLPGIELHVLPSPVSTTFTNIYHDGQRRQYIQAVAAPLATSELPPALTDAPVVLLGPVAREVPPQWASAFPQALVGLGAQGWMRSWDDSGRVSPAPWDSAADFLPHVGVLFLSREDVGGDETRIAELGRQVRLMVVTEGWRGCRVYRDGSSEHVPPRPAREVDPTGAGDVFAAAFLLRLAECGDPLAAARFANIAASFSVEGVGMTAIPSRVQVDEWLANQGETGPLVDCEAPGKG